MKKDDVSYCIRGDLYLVVNINSKRFISLSEYRKQKLDKIKNI